MHHALDLSRHHFCQPHFGKGITVYGTWFQQTRGRYRPCLVLVPSLRQHTHTRVTPCVILVDDAHLWAEETFDPVYVHNTIHHVFADRLGKEPTSAHQCAEILSCIHDEMGRLLSIPPSPPGQIVVAADARLIDENGRERHAEILERE